MKTAIILISEAGLSIAQSLLNELPDSEIFTLRHEEGCTHIESAGKFTAENFNRYDAFVFIGAMGICVRTIAPCVKNKYTDPAVVCVDSTGKFAISVLSGHIGGANELTHQVANILGAEPVVTTQSDCTGLWGLDTLPQRFGWFPVINAEPSTLLLAELAKTPEEKKRVCMNEHISLFVSGKPTALLLTVRNEGTDWMEAHLPPHVEVFYRVQDINPSRFKLILCVSPQVPNFPEMPMICYVPCVVHLGIGLARLAGPVRKVEKEIMNTLKEYGIMPQSIASISTIKAKSDEPVVKALQKKFPVYFYTAEELAEIEVPHPSKTVMKHMGTPSVSEAAALLSANNSRLLVPKKKGENYTVAAALDIRTVRQGHIEIVGAGPGDPDLVSVRGRQMLERADLILYAGSLVPKELTLCAKAGATVLSSASMDLEEQFEVMKKFYDKGKFIVRLHTGDPCIYGAIQEQMNYFDQHGMSYHITPGISSFQAAAAALKSQFTIPEKVQSIILTRGEGRTPMPEREKLHLMARSQSTMCIFLSASIAKQVQEELLQEYPERADLILYAGSLVPKELTLCAKAGATVLSSASMDLEEQFEVMKKFYDKGKFIVRLHTGDPCIYGAIQEQMNYFDQHGMSYHITPGISSFQAAAAALKSQFTIPEKVQSIILTRGEGRTPMPEREKLHLMARSQSTMCIFLSASIAKQVQEELLQEYPETTPVAVCYHLTWKDEQIFRGELKDLARIVKENNLTLTTMIVVGEAIGNREGLSRLYAHEFKHLYRK